MEAGEVMVSLLILLPLGGSALLLAFGRRLGEPAAGALGTLTVASGFGLALVAGWEFLAGTGEAQTIPWFDWLPALGVTAGLLWDPLSALMAMVVTGVGALIHVYSLGYMRDDPRFGRFFAYMNLFVASDADAGPRRRLRPALRGLGTGRPLLVSAHLVLVREAGGGRGRQEGLRGQPGRRRRVPGWR